MHHQNQKPEKHNRKPKLLIKPKKTNKASKQDDDHKIIEEKQLPVEVKEQQVNEKETAGVKQQMQKPVANRNTGTKELQNEDYESSSSPYTDDYDYEPSEDEDEEFKDELMDRSD